MEGKNSKGRTIKSELQKRGGNKLPFLIVQMGITTAKGTCLGKCNMEKILWEKIVPWRGYK